MLSFKGLRKIINVFLFSKWHTSFNISTPHCGSSSGASCDVNKALQIKQHLVYSNISLRLVNIYIYFRLERAIGKLENTSTDSKTDIHLFVWQIHVDVLLRFNTGTNSLIPASHIWELPSQYGRSSLCYSGIDRLGNDWERRTPFRIFSGHITIPRDPSDDGSIGISVSQSCKATFQDLWR